MASRPEGCAYPRPEALIARRNKVARLDVVKAEYVQKPQLTEFAERRNP